EADFQEGLHADRASQYHAVQELSRCPGPHVCAAAISNERWAAGPRRALHSTSRVTRNDESSCRRQAAAAILVTIEYRAYRSRRAGALHSRQSLRFGRVAPVVSGDPEPLVARHRHPHTTLRMEPL